ncbi:regulator [Bacillus lacus]|uniref:Regulator n=2 Tax=Metabacillus lacus TaxID=1983721 RepID=A0A7X2IX19_9BACI|nr:regulator [Metabacillus lacus]
MILSFSILNSGLSMENSQIQQEAHEVSGPLNVTVVLERIYLDGEVSEEIRKEKIWAMEDFWAEFADWQLVHQDEEQIVFQQKVDDISPLLKSNGYFGITENGILSIFNGKPHHTQKVIQSFFQIDVKKLETRKHKQLQKGIPVKTKNQYKKVIETFRAYSAEAAQK